MKLPGVLASVDGLCFQHEEVFQSNPIRTPGTYAVTAVPYDRPNAAGTRGAPLAITLQVVNQTFTPTPSPTLTPMPSATPTAPFCPAGFQSFSNMTTITATIGREAAANAGDLYIPIFESPDEISMNSSTPTSAKIVTGDGRLNDTGSSTTTISNMGVAISNGVLVGNGTCSREYRHASNIPTVFDPILGGNIRGFVQAQPNISVTPIPPSQAPAQP